jgi:phage gp46-like protein
MMSDFTLSMQNGIPCMSYESTDSIVNDIILSLTIRARSLETTNGASVFPGDWWFNPDFGHNCYEVKTTSDSDIRLVIQLTQKALEWIKKTGKAKSFSVSATRDANANRINRQIVALQSNGQTITYIDFIEVQ